MNIILSKFGKKFSNRPMAKQIFGTVESNSVITIDLEGVEEVTPSFFHEMLEILVKEKSNTIKISNLSDFLRTQLNKAEASFVNK